MRPLLALLACGLLPYSASGQIVGEAAEAGRATSNSGAAVAAVPLAVSVPALSLSPALGSSLSPAAAVAPKPDAPVPALAPSLITPIDAKALPAKGKDLTTEQWGSLVAGAKDEGTRAVLNSMRGDTPTSPQVSVKLNDGETVSGSFRGIAGGKMVFESDGKLLGVGMNTGDIAEVRRKVDVFFDGATIRPDEVVVHNRPPVADPFTDLAAYKGRVVELEIRDLDDLKYSAQDVSGRLVKADGEEIQLVSAKGTTHIQKKYHRVDKAALRTDHYSSYGKIATIADVEGKVPLGAPVELVLAGGAKVRGRFFGLKRDAQGPFVLIETPAAGGTAFRGYRDFHDLRTPGYDEGELLPGVEPLAFAPR